MDLEKQRTEALRWRILQVLNNGRPYPVAEDLLMATVGGDDFPVTPLEVRKELDYLGGRDLIEIKGKDGPRWSSSLTRYGVDVVEYTVDCHPGIARPKKYW